MTPILGGRAAVTRLLGGASISPERSVQWDSVYKEGLLGLVAYEQIESRQDVPDEIRHLFRQSIAYDLKCRSALNEISRAAWSKGIPVLTFKGCSLSNSIYPKPGQRTFGDIDLASPGESLTGLRETLTNLGFHQQDSATYVREQLCLDLHTHPLHQLRSLFARQETSWWDSTARLSEATGETLRLSQSLELALALLHGAKHAFSRAIWTIDIALLAQSLAPAELTETISTYRLTRHYAYADACLREWFDLPLPQPQKLQRVNLTRLENSFLSRVKRRRAPEFLGMLTPLNSAPNPKAALHYLWASLFPREIPLRTRLKQLGTMIRKACYE